MLFVWFKFLLLIFLVKQTFSQTGNKNRNLLTTVNRDTFPTFMDKNYLNQLNEKNIHKNQNKNSNPKIFNIGAVLEQDEFVQDFLQVMDSIYYEPNILPPGVNLYPFNLILNRNPVQVVQNICDKLIKNQVYAIIVKDGNNAESLAVTQTFNFYNIPVIGISNRESSMSDKHMHPFYMRMIPPYSHQVIVWIEILRYLKYRHIVFIHSAEYDGRTTFTRFQALAEQNNIEISSVIEYEPSRTNIVNELEEINEELQSRVYLLYTNELDAQSIFFEVNRLNLTKDGYVWLVSEQALKANNVPNGAISLKLFNETNESGYIRDALYIISMAVSELYLNENITSLPPLYCGNIAKNNWKMGDKLFNILRKQTISYGKTGRVAFDGKGDRIDADYEIVNVIQGRQVVVGNYAFSQSKMRMQLWLNENSIIWPGYLTVKPVGYVLPSKLKIVTLSEKPFVWTRPLNEDQIDILRLHVINLNKQLKLNETNLEINGQYSSLINKHHNQQDIQQNIKHRSSSYLDNNEFLYRNYKLEFNDELIQQEFCYANEVLCTKYNKKLKKNQYFCCKGYCIDFLLTLASRLNISYTLYQVADGQYGSYEYRNNDYKKSWNGLVGEIVNKNADLIVAPLTINPERSLFIDFSKPFKYQGITIISKHQIASRSSLASFMEPFEDSLWILVIVSVHVVALVLYLLDRFSPFGRYRLPNCEITEEDALNLSSAIWFAWGVILNSGIGEGSPRSFGGRLLGMIWAGFAMIIIASYTGNLAAFLVLNRPETALTGINDSRLRNPTDNYTYSTVKNSAVEMYFKRQLELKNIYNHLIKNKRLETVEEGIEAVRNNEINAFIWDSARLEYEASQDCELNIASEQFGRSGYGMGLSKNSFWTEKVNQAILSMHESGYMERLDNEWILNPNPECVNRDTIRSTLGLKNMAGVFILVGIGIVGGIGLIMIEMIYKKQQNKKQKQLETARYAADKWKKYTNRKKSINLSIQYQKQNRGKQIESQTYLAKKVSADQINRLKRAEFANLRSQEEFQSTSDENSLQHNESTVNHDLNPLQLEKLQHETRIYKPNLTNTQYWSNSTMSECVQDNYGLLEINKNLNEKKLNKAKILSNTNKRSIQLPVKVHIQENQQDQLNNQKLNNYNKYNKAKYVKLPKQKSDKKNFKHYQQLKHQHAISESNSSLLQVYPQQNYIPSDSIQTNYRNMYNENYCETPNVTSHVKSSLNCSLNSNQNSPSKNQIQLIKPPHVLAYQNNKNHNFFN